MGMAASQARFLSLTARKSNTEYQGQQINQERTALANESSNIYAQLSKMDVPAPPNTADFYKTVYNFNTNLLSGENTKYVLDEIVSTPGGDKAYISTSKDYYAVQASYLKKNINESDLSYDSDEIKKNYKQEEWTNLQITGGGVNAYILTTTSDKVSSDLEFLVDPSDGGNEIFKNAYCNEDGSIKPDVNVYYYKVGNKPYYLDPSAIVATKNADGTSTYKTSDNYSSASFSIGTNKTTVNHEYEVSGYNKNDIGRYTDITIKYYPLDNEGKEDKTKEPIETTFKLDCTKVEDEEAYEQAMRDYEYEYAKYQKAVSDLNNKTEDIQQKDKTLELELKQLDTEQNAIKTEMDAVTKVVEDNVESTFKTFG